MKTPKKELQADGSYLCEVSIPNREIAAVYKSEILSHFLQTGAIQGLQQIRLQKVFMPMITRSCRALLGNIWINQLASSMVELKDFIMV